MKWLIITATGLICFVAAVTEPKLLANNRFLDGLVSFELVSILVVFLTVTMASIANMQLALGRLNVTLRNMGADVSKEISEARSEMASNAWWLFALFCLQLGLLLIKGGVESERIIAAVHGATIVVITVNLVILYDLYTAIYELASLDYGSGSHPGQSGNDGSEVSDHDRQDR